MKLPSLSYLFDAYKNVFVRFTIPAVVALIGTISCSVLIEENQIGNQDAIFEFFFKTLLACTIGFPLFISGVILKETYQWTLTKSLVFNLLVLVFLVIFHIWWAPDFETEEYTKILRFALFILSAHLSVSFVAFFQADQLSNFWEFNRRLFVQFVIGTLYAIVIFGGLAIAILAVDELFGLNIDGEIYGHLFAWTAGIMHTSYFLANFPKIYRYDLEAQDFQIAFVNLIKYVLIPISILYFLILYAFTAKILINWELPKGWVASLVIGFSVAGIFTYLLNYLLPNFFESSLARQFRRWFFYVLLPMVVLLFVAIMRRVNDYGFTEERYYVLLTGIWLSFICVYFILSKKDDIRIIPISLLAFCVLSLFGPWSTFSISKNSQKNQIERILSENGILENGQIKKHDPILTGDAAADINNILYYLSDRNYLEVLQPLSTTDLKSGEDSNSKRVEDLLAQFGVQKDAYRNYDQNEMHYYNSSQNYNEAAISGYDHFSPIYLPAGSGEVIFLNLESDGHTLVTKLDGQPVDTFSMKPTLEKWRNEWGKNRSDIAPDQLTFSAEGNKTGIKIIFQTLSVNWASAEPRIENGYGFLFWKRKD